MTRVQKIVSRALTQALLEVNSDVLMTDEEKDDAKAHLLDVADRRLRMMVEP
jgi:hypothetical protein